MGKHTGKSIIDLNFVSVSRTLSSGFSYRQRKRLINNRGRVDGVSESGSPDRRGRDRDHGYRGLARKALAGTPYPDYGIVGRWLAYMPHGRFWHRAISAAPALKGERLIGWTAHYVTGIGFAVLLLAVFGPAWSRNPTPGPALIVGIGSVAAPFLLMQPGMGQGLPRTGRPARAQRGYEASSRT